MDIPQFTIVDRIPVTVGKHHPAGALHPIAHADDLLLRASVGRDASAAIGVNVDSLVLIDAFEDGTVFDVEVLVPRSYWARGEFKTAPAAIPVRGSIVLSVPGSDIYVDGFSPRVLHDGQGWLFVQLEPSVADTQWIELSSCCFALVADGYLAGFVARC